MAGPVLVACATFGHAELMAGGTQFRDAGWNFEHIHSGLNKRERSRMLRGIRAGTIHGLCTVGIGLKEWIYRDCMGLDMAKAYTVIDNLPSNLSDVFCARYPGKKYGVILDPVGNLCFCMDGRMRIGFGH